MLDLLKNNILQPEFFYSIIRVATPLLLATMGVVITSHAGITNIGIEGVMLLSALSAVIASAYLGGPMVGLLVAICIGVLSSLLIGYVSLKLRTDSVLTCIAFNTMMSGGTVYFMYALTGDKGTTIALRSGSLPNIQIPILSDIPILGVIFSNHNLMSYLAWIMVGMTAVLLYKTRVGLRIRAAGKAPQALSSVGISVVKVKMIALAISGVFGGMAGAFLSLGYVTWFSKDMTAGRGFIALAADAMGNSTPLGSALSALLFAASEALSYALQLTKLPTELIQAVPYMLTIVGLVLYVWKKQKQEKRRNLLLQNRLKGASTYEL